MRISGAQSEKSLFKNARTFISQSYCSEELVDQRIPSTGTKSLKEPIQQRVAKLREEIARIKEANRKYFLQRRSWEAESGYQRRVERLQEILEELAALMDWRKM